MSRLLLSVSFTALLMAGLWTYGSSALAQSSEQERRNRSITGRVLNEVGQPIANAAVRVYKASLSERENRSATTDDEGKFQVDDLKSGAYRVNAWVPGYVSAEDPLEPRYYRPGDSVAIRVAKGSVITGRVTDSTGEPVIAVSVYALRVRDIDGRPLKGPTYSSGPRQTDDRGIYRLYGLLPGYYVVAAGGGFGFSYGSSPFATDAPTYYPSSTRDTAAEVTVRGNDEVTGIDIRYRGERGHAVSGSVSGALGTDSRSVGVSISLRSVPGGAVQATTFLPVRGDDRSFALYGIPDGEYELMAQRGFGAEDSAASSPRRVTVKGADVTGIELTLAPLGSIAGRVNIEAQQDAAGKTDCKEKDAALIEESVLIARLDRKDQPLSILRSLNETTPTDKGDFTIPNLNPGRFRIETNLPSENWYVRAITLPAPTAASKASDIARNGITVKSGDRVTGINIAIARGAASVRGRITPASEGASLPARMRVYLVPAERENAEDVLRYFEAAMKSEGTFAITNIAPGRYWLLSRATPDDELTDISPRPAAWDDNDRASLRRDAEAMNTVIELKPCQRVTEYVLRYASPKKQAPSRRQ